MPSTPFVSLFPKKYASMPDGGKKKKKNRFFPSFKKKVKNHEVLIETVNEDSSTVALSQLSSNPPSPARTSSDAVEDPPLWTSFDDNGFHEDETNDSSDLLIFTSASNDTDDPPLHVLAAQPLTPTISSLSEHGSIFHSPQRKTKMPKALAPKQKQEEHKPKADETSPKQDYTSMPIDLDTYDEWHDDESHWVEFVDERKDQSDWGGWTADIVDWGHAPMDELAELPVISTTNSFEYGPKDTSDEASLDPSTVSFSSAPLSSMIVHETSTGDVEVCDPECPLRFFPNGNEDGNEEPPENTPGYPFVSDGDEEEPAAQQRPSKSSNRRQRTSQQQQTQSSSMFSSLSYYQDQFAAKFKPSEESREHMAHRLHNDTLALIGSVSEKLHTWDSEARQRFQSSNNNNSKTREQPVQPQNDEISIATSASIETRKKGNTSYFSSDAFNYSSTMFDGGCNFIEPFLRYGQAEV
ncbi:unnamed protein product [Cylindrotheca closterium]|uniref:Uncharacterized protein n=1 Tax=Cylindrotheca closterium TaxID=2856 RepID=A0AAD2CJU8_9STRA|nr:unnamed protein product [Cylindrotheca closterium]